jgi:hypothetical protein
VSARILLRFGILEHPVQLFAEPQIHEANKSHRVFVDDLILAIRGETVSKQKIFRT